MTSLFLAFIQGLTEFLPVSSSAHLFLFEYFFKSKEGFLFHIALHLGTVLAIISFYHKILLELLKDLVKNIFNLKSDSIKFIYYLFISCIPTAFIGYLLLDFVTSLKNNPLVIASCLFLTGMMLLSLNLLKSAKTYSFKTKMKDLDISSLNTLKAFLIGLIQGICVIPGLSRSGWTISTGLFLGLKPQLASFYSFILSIPAIIGASFLAFSKIPQKLEMKQIFLGLSYSYIFSLLGLYLVIYFLKKKKLTYFSYYLFILSLIVFILVL